jgi:hypothetical protein
MSKIFDCQQHLADLLNADPFFNDPVTVRKIEVITQRKGDIQKKVQESLMKLGCGVIIQLPLATWEGEAERLTLGLKFGIIVTENPLINQGSSGTLKPAEDIVESVIRVVHWKTNGVAVNPNARDGRFVIDRNAVRMMPPTPGTASLLNYIVAVNTLINLSTDPPPPSDPPAKGG